MEGNTNLRKAIITGVVTTTNSKKNKSKEVHCLIVQYSWRYMLDNKPSNEMGMIMTSAESTEKWKDSDVIAYTAGLRDFVNVKQIDEIAGKQIYINNETKQDSKITFVDINNPLVSYDPTAGKIIKR